MQRYRSPGIYIDETSSFPGSIKQVETAIPAFIGYTEKGPAEPTRITSLADYESLFGKPCNELPEFKVDGTSGTVTTVGSISTTPVYLLYYQVQMFFTNGGNTCYIISVGVYKDPASISVVDMKEGLNKLNEIDEPTLILLPEAPGISDNSAGHSLFVDAMKQCKERGDRFAICDVKSADLSSTDPAGDAAEVFRNHIGTEYLSFGAAYFPYLETTITHHYREAEVKVTHTLDKQVKVLRLPDETINREPTLASTSLYHSANGSYAMAYLQIRKMIESVKLVLPPSGAVAGIYVMVDQSRGVWKAPANISINGVTGPTLLLTNMDQQNLNISPSGKSINVIRSFPGKGTLIWGARTLAGNSSEWKYISVRRFCNMVQESVEKTLYQLVNEPNDANTWTKVKTMIENFLTQMWREGALAGPTPKEAFFVKTGLGETMTQQDITEGRLIAEIGMALTRPAEFILLRFSQQLKVPE